MNIQRSCRPKRRQTWFFDWQLLFLTMTKRRRCTVKTTWRVFAVVALLLFCAECRAQHEGILTRPTLKDKFGDNLHELEEQTTDEVNGHTSSKYFKFSRNGEIVEKRTESGGGLFYSLEKQIPVEKGCGYVKAMESEWTAKFGIQNEISYLQIDTLSSGKRIIYRKIIKGTAPNPFLLFHKRKKYIRIEEQRQNLLTLTDSFFTAYANRKGRVDTASCHLKEVRYYTNANLDTICKKVLFDGSNSVCLFTTHSFLPKGEECCFYLRDSTSTKYHYVYTDRNLIDTVYLSGSYNPSNDNKGWSHIKTFQYEFYDNGAVAVERRYWDGKLVSTTRYKVKYYEE